MKRLKLAILLAICTHLFGCVSAAKMEGIVYRELPKTYPEDLRANVRFGTVSGGKMTIPILFPKIGNGALARAMEESLRSQGLLSEDGAYRLDVQLLGIDQPYLGLRQRAKTRVRYKLTHIASEQVVLNKLIYARYETRINEAFTEVTRRRLAVEGAARENIEAFLKELTRFDTASPHAGPGLYHGNSRSHEPSLP